MKQTRQTCMWTLHGRETRARYRAPSGRHTFSRPANAREEGSGRFEAFLQVFSRAGGGGPAGGTARADPSGWLLAHAGSSRAKAEK